MNNRRVSSSSDERTVRADLSRLERHRTYIDVHLEDPEIASQIREALALTQWIETNSGYLLHGVRLELSRCLIATTPRDPMEGVDQS